MYDPVNKWQTLCTTFTIEIMFYRPSEFYINCLIFEIVNHSNTPQMISPPKPIKEVLLNVPILNTTHSILQWEHSLVNFTDIYQSHGYSSIIKRVKNMPDRQPETINTFQLHKEFLIIIWNTFVEARFLRELISNNYCI